MPATGDPVAARGRESTESADSVTAAADGRFSLPVASGDGVTLVVSHPGYYVQRVPVDEPGVARRGPPRRHRVDHRPRRGHRHARPGGRRPGELHQRPAGDGRGRLLGAGSCRAAVAGRAGHVHQQRPGQRHRLLVLLDPRVRPGAHARDAQRRAAERRGVGRALLHRPRRLPLHLRRHPGAARRVRPVGARRRGGHHDGVAVGHARRSRCTPASGRTARHG